MSGSRNMVFFIEKWLSFHTQACGFYAAIYNKVVRWIAEIYLTAF